MCIWWEKCNSYQWWNNDKCQCECKKRHKCGKDYIWNPSTGNCENGKWLASIMDDLAITCDEIIDSYVKKSSFNEKKAICKTQNFKILLAFLSIIIALLIAASIFCYLIKYQAKQKHLLSFHNTNNELKQDSFWQYKSKMSNKVKDFINIKIFDLNNIKKVKYDKNILVY